MSDLTPSKTAIEQYRSATTVAEMDATGVPAVIHRRMTDNLQEHVEPAVRAHSSQRNRRDVPYLWYANAISAAMGFKARGKGADDIREAGTEAYAERVFLEHALSEALPELAARHFATDPQKGYHGVLKDAKKLLQDRLTTFRADKEAAELDMLGRIA